MRKYGTLSEAAEKLNISQPAVSRSMKKLEDELGVQLFDRTKNRITLNKTGILAAEYAERILKLEDEMKIHIINFDKNLNSIKIGSISPGPLMLILTRLASCGTVISSNIYSDSELTDGLKNSKFRLIILNHPIDDENYICKEFVTEHLYISVNHFHPAAMLKQVNFKEMDGQNFIMYAYVGFWEDIVKTKMPHSKFYKQEDIYAVDELAGMSDLPSFSTNISQKLIPSRNKERINIPLSDAEATAEFYLIYNKDDRKLFDKLYV